MPQPHQLTNIVLVKVHRSRVRDLRGFRKAHQVPTEVNEHTNGFIGRVAAEDISLDLDARFSDFRKLLKFKRVDLQVTEPTGGVGTITTPWFDYQVSVSLVDDDASEVMWRRQVAEFRDPQSLFSSAFGSVFGNTFDTVELLTPSSIDLAAFIDTIEDRNSDSVTLEYDRNASWCHVGIPGVMGQMRLTADRISLIVAQPQSPLRLLEAFYQVRTQFAGIEGF